MSDCDMCGGTGNTYTREGKGMCLLCEVVLLEAEVARLKAALKLKENDEGIWLHVKTEKLEGAVLVAAKDEPRGPIMMAVLRAALAEQEGGA